MYEHIGLLFSFISVLFIVYIYYSRPNYIEGFWVADDVFCEESDISSMLLYIGPGSTAPGYLVIMDNVCNQGFEVKIGMNRALSPTKYSINCDFIFDDEPIWPQSCHVNIDMATGTMTITSGKELLAVLRKDTS